MTPRTLAVSTWGQLANLGILPPLMRMTDEAPTAAVAAAPADEPGRAGYLVRLRGGEGAQVTVPEPDPNEPASQIDDDSPRQQAIGQNGATAEHYVCNCGNDGRCGCGSA